MATDKFTYTDKDGPLLIVRADGRAEWSDDSPPPSAQRLRDMEAARKRIGKAAE